MKEVRLKKKNHLVQLPITPKSKGMLRQNEFI